MKVGILSVFLFLFFFNSCHGQGTISLGGAGSSSTGAALHKVLSVIRKVSFLPSLRPPSFLPS